MKFEDVYYEVTKNYVSHIEAQEAREHLRVGWNEALLAAAALISDTNPLKKQILRLKQKPPK